MKYYFNQFSERPIRGVAVLLFSIMCGQGKQMKPPRATISLFQQTLKGHRKKEREIMIKGEIKTERER